MTTISLADDTALAIAEIATRDCAALTSASVSEVSDKDEPTILSESFAQLALSSSKKTGDSEAIVISNDHCLGEKIGVKKGFDRRRSKHAKRAHNKSDAKRQSPQPDIGEADGEDKAFNNRVACKTENKSMCKRTASKKKKKLVPTVENPIANALQPRRNGNYKNNKDGKEPPIKKSPSAFKRYYKSQNFPSHLIGSQPMMGTTRLINYYESWGYFTPLKPNDKPYGNNPFHETNALKESVKSRGSKKENTKNIHIEQQQAQVNAVGKITNDVTDDITSEKPVPDSTVTKVAAS